MRLAAALALCLAAVPALAGDPAALAEGQSLCWARTYDAKHLKAQPQQAVTAITLSISREADIEDLIFVIGTRLRGDAQDWGNSGGCRRGPDGRLDCYVDCDGGGFHLKPEANGGLLLQNDKSGFALLSCQESDEPEAEPSVAWLAPEGEHKAFRLPAAPDEACPAMTLGAAE